MNIAPPMIDNTDAAGAAGRSAASTENEHSSDPFNHMGHIAGGAKGKAETTMPQNGESTKISDSGAEQAQSLLKPIIATAIPHKYYQVPAGLKSLRPKRKVAIVFGYIGEKYCGLQWNHLPNYPTVEEAILKAMFECDLISLENFSSQKLQQLIGFERASRTDKGVHALRNVISVNIMLPYSAAYVAAWERRRAEAYTVEGGLACDVNADSTRCSTEAAPSAVTNTTTTTTTTACDDNDDDDDNSKYSYLEAKHLLNTALPRDIVVYDVVPVTRSFNAYLCCGGRRYEYYLPTFALLPRERYASEYFPASLAPAHPPAGDGDCSRRLRQRAAKDDNDVMAEGGEWTADSVEQGRGLSTTPRGLKPPKRRGHFPMRKNKRQRLAALEEEQKNYAEDGESNGEGNISENSAPEARTCMEGEPPEDVVDLAPCMAKEKTGAAEIDPVAAPTTPTRFHDGIFETLLLYRRIPQDAMRRVAAYRISPAQLALVRELFRGYEGTHPFHNFTPGGRSDDPSCHRFIQSVTVSDPFTIRPTDEGICQSLMEWTPFRFFSPDEGIAEDYRERWQAQAEEACGKGCSTLVKAELRSGVDCPEEDPQLHRVEVLRGDVHKHMCDVYGDAGLEVVRIEIEGQSFMLNQIRKMIGAVVAMAAAGLPTSYLETVLLRKGNRCGIPMAPANGLLLSSLEFKRYNYRLQRIQQAGRNAEDKRALEVDQVPTEEVMRQRDRTVAVMLRNEMASDIMGKWMRSLRCVLRLAWGIEVP